MLEFVIPTIPLSIWNFRHQLFHYPIGIYDINYFTIKLEFVTPTAATRPVGDDFALVGGK